MGDCLLSIRHAREILSYEDWWIIVLTLWDTDAFQSNVLWHFVIFHLIYESTHGPLQYNDIFILNQNISRQSYMCIIRELFLWPHSHVRTIPIASIGSATSGAWMIAATMMWQMPCIMILWFSSRMRTRWRGICGSSGAPRWRRKWRRRCTATMTMMMRVVMRMMLGFHCIRVLSSDRDITIGINLLYYHLILKRPAVYIVTRIIIWLFRECVLEKEELSN